MGTLKKRVKENLFFEIIIGLTVAIIVGLLTYSTGYIQNLFSDQNNEISQSMGQQPTSTISDHELAYSKLEELATGISAQNLESIFGTPRAKRPLDNKYSAKQIDGKYISRELSDNYDGFIERIFVDPRYYVQTISTKDEVVVFYSVTSRTEDFNPKVPIEIYSLNESGQPYDTISNLRIGKMSFGDIEGYKPERCDVAVWISQPSYYVESNYFGNPGGYDHYLFSIATAGFGSEEQQSMIISFDRFLIDNKTNNMLLNQSFISWREAAKPNAYGVLAEYRTYEELLEYIIREGFAPNSVDARKL